MKRKIGILLAVLAVMAPMANAVVVNIEVGDRPYLYPWARLLCWPRLLGLDSGTLGLASPSQSLDPRPLRTTLSSCCGLILGRIFAVMFAQICVRGQLPMEGTSSFWSK